MELVKVNFVIDCSDSTLAEYINLKNENASSTFVRGDLNWCLQSYLILRKRNKTPITCSNQLVKNCINIIHSDTLLILKGISSHFIVCVRADYPKRLWAHYHLVQNKNQVSSMAFYIPHWVQPNLIKRDTNKNSPFTVAYAGQPSNGNMAGTSDTWKRLLEPHNIRFEAINAGSWHDLSSVDVLVGIRSFDKKEYNTKPPTKLFNAWHAWIPFVGGNDSAYKQVGTPGGDYLIATTPDEVLTHILKLKSDPQFYNRIVNEGCKKASLYSEQEISLCWENLLGGPILQRYKKWQKRKIYERFWFKLKLGMALPEHRSKQFLKLILRRLKMFGFKE